MEHVHHGAVGGVQNKKTTSNFHHFHFFFGEVLSFRKIRDMNWWSPTVSGTVCINQYVINCFCFFQCAPILR